VFIKDVFLIHPLNTFAVNKQHCLCLLATFAILPWSQTVMLPSSVVLATEVEGDAEEVIAVVDDVVDAAAAAEVAVDAADVEYWVTLRQEDQQQDWEDRVERWNSTYADYLCLAYLDHHHRHS
jgi:hypothetical protein